MLFDADSTHLHQNNSSSSNMDGEVHIKNMEFSVSVPEVAPMSDHPSNTLLARRPSLSSSSLPPSTNNHVAGQQQQQQTMTHRPSGGDPQQELAIPHHPSSSSSSSLDAPILPPTTSTPPTMGPIVQSVRSGPSLPYPLPQHDDDLCDHSALLHTSLVTNTKFLFQHLKPLEENPSFEVAGAPLRANKNTPNSSKPSNTVSDQPRLSQHAPSVEQCVDASSSSSSHHPSSHLPMANPLGANLSSSDPLPVDAKPPFSYSYLIASAILSAPSQRMSVREIYDHIMSSHPYFTQPSTGTQWKNAVRHNLSLNPNFMRVIEGAAVKGGDWGIRPDRYHAIMALVNKNTSAGDHLSFPSTSTNLFSPEGFKRRENLAGRNLKSLQKRGISFGADSSTPDPFSSSSLLADADDTDAVEGANALLSFSFSSPFKNEDKQETRLDAVESSFPSHSTPSPHPHLSTLPLHASPNSMSSPSREKPQPRKPLDLHFDAFSYRSPSSLSSPFSCPTIPPPLSSTSHLHSHISNPILLPRHVNEDPSFASQSSRGRHLVVTSLPESSPSTLLTSSPSPSPCPSPSWPAPSMHLSSPRNTANRPPRSPHSPSFSSTSKLPKRTPPSCSSSNSKKLNRSLDSTVSPQKRSSSGRIVYTFSAPQSTLPAVLTNVRSNSPSPTRRKRVTSISEEESTPSNPPFTTTTTSSSNHALPFLNNPSSSSSSTSKPSGIFSPGPHTSSTNNSPKTSSSLNNSHNNSNHGGPALQTMLSPQSRALLHAISMDPSPPVSSTSAPNGSLPNTSFPSPFSPAHGLPRTQTGGRHPRTTTSSHHPSPHQSSSPDDMFATSALLSLASQHLSPMS